MAEEQGAVAGDSTLTEKVHLEVAVPAPNLGGLDAVLAKLREVDGFIDRLNKKFATVTATRSFQRSAAQFSTRIQTTGRQSVQTLSEVFGFNPADVRQFADQLIAEERRQIQRLRQLARDPKSSGREKARLQEQIKGIEQSSFFTSLRGDELRSPATAGRFFEAFERQLTLARHRVFREAQREPVNPPVSQVHAEPARTPARGRGRAQAGAPPPAPQPEGPVSLKIPAGQIHATVDGPVMLKIPAAQVRAEGAVPEKGSGGAVSQPQVGLDPGAVRRSRAEIERALKGVATGKGAVARVSEADLLRITGLPSAAELDSFLSGHTDEILKRLGAARAKVSAAGQAAKPVFLPQAVRVAEEVEKVRALPAPAPALAAGPSAKLTPAQIAPSITGPIPLPIAPAQIQPVVTGPIPVTIPGSLIVPTVKGPVQAGPPPAQTASPSVPMPPGKVVPSITGPIPLPIAPALIQPVVTGPIPVTIPGSLIVPTVQGPVRTAAPPPAPVLPAASAGPAPIPFLPSPQLPLPFGGVKPAPAPGPAAAAPASGAVSPPAVPGKVTPSVTGPIPLLIPPGQIQASVTGPIPVTAQGSQMVVAVQGPIPVTVPGNLIVPTLQGPVTPPGAAKPGGSGGAPPSGGGGGGGGAGAGAGAGPVVTPFLPGQSQSELRRVIRVTPSQARTFVTEARSLGTSVTQVFNEVGDVVAEVTDVATAKKLTSQIQSQKQAVTQRLRGQVGALEPGDFLGLAGAQKVAADELDKILTPQLQAALSAKQLKDVEDKIRAESGRLRQSATGAVRKQTLADVREQRDLIAKARRAQLPLFGRGDNLARAQIFEQEAEGLKKVLSEDVRQVLSPRRFAQIERAIAKDIDLAEAKASTERRKAGEAVARAFDKQVKQGSFGERAFFRKLEKAKRDRIKAEQKAEVADEKARNDTRAAQQKQLNDIVARARKAGLVTPAAPGMVPPVMAGFGAVPSPAPAMPPPRAPVPAGFPQRVRSFFTGGVAPPPPPPPPPSGPPAGGFLPPTPPPRGASIVGGIPGLTPLGFVTNVARVTAWGAAVGALGAATATAARSIRSLIDVGQQTARLDQVFTGVGGSARDLADDVLRLAVIHGRSADEALESAIAWARLGLTRREVNEAVRVSLMAANVAELSAAEATEHLSALFVVYGLRADELNGVLGQLNNTSNTMNVTNRDLLEGLSRVAAVAKQAGVPLEELQGILGATVGATGQTGANIGNALKSLIVSLSNPEIQELLRREPFNLEVTTAGGDDIRQMNDILGDLFVTFQRLNDQERQNLLIRIAGKFQASRVVAILESYTTAQRLAVDGLLNLNSAEIENARITAELKSRLTGLGTAFDRFSVNSLGGVKRGLTEVIGLFSNLLDVTASSSALAGDLGALTFDAADRLTGGQLKKPRQLGLSAEDALKSVPNLGLGFLNATVRELRQPGSNALDRLTEQAETAGSAFEGLELRAKNLRRFGRALSEALPERREALAGRIAPHLEGEDRARFEALARTQDIAGAIAVLEENAVAAREDAARQQQRAADIEAQQLAIIDARVKKIKAAGTAEAENSRELAALEARRRGIAERGAKREFAVENELDPGQPQFRRNQQRAETFLETQELVLRRISELYRQIPAERFTAQLELQTAELEDQLSFLEEQSAALDRSSLALGSFGADLVNKTSDAIRKVTAQLESLRSPAALGFARALDRRQFAVRSAGVESAGFGIGTSEGEQLVERERRLIAELNRINDLGRQRRLGDEEIARGLQFQTDLLRTQEDQQLRLIKLRGEENQVLTQNTRELQRSLLLATPGGLLQKLAVSQLFRGRAPGLGELFALSPDARQSALDQAGGSDLFNLRRERRELESRAGRAPEATTLDQNLVSQFQARTRELMAGMSAGIMEGLTGTLRESATAALALNQLGLQAAYAATSLGLLPGVVDKIQAALDAQGPRPQTEAGPPALPAAEGTSPGARRLYPFGPGFVF